MGVRALAEPDIPQVASLYWSHMRKRKGPAPVGLQPFIRELFFRNPFCSNSAQSLVYEDKDGQIVGFLGGSVRRMSVLGQSIQAVFGGNLVVHPKARSGGAAPRLIATFLDYENDLMLTDSANEITRKILGRMNFRVVPALNIHWVRPLRPSRYAVAVVTRGMDPGVSRGLNVVAKPFCAVADGVLGRFAGSPFRQTKSALSGSEMDADTLLQCLAEFREGYSLWTEYEKGSLEWLLNFMASRPSRGTLRRIAVRGENGKLVGWYIYYVKRGTVGEVVQIGGEAKRTKEILDHLFQDAWEQGVVGLHGVVDMRRMPDFSDKGCLFTCRGGWTIVRSKRSDLFDLLERGDAFLTRLDGEWALDPGD